MQLILHEATVERFNIYDTIKFVVQKVTNIIHKKLLLITRPLLSGRYAPYFE